MHEAKVPILYERRGNLCERLFCKMLNPSHEIKLVSSIL